MTPHSINSENNFIAGWTPKDVSVCDRLIEYFNKSGNKKPGVIHKGGVDTNLKNSTDAFLEDYDLFVEYIYWLQESLNEYIKLYPWVAEFDAWHIVENINILHYAPTQGYHAWHTERGGGNFPGRSRHMTFMTYLNDVDDQGETEWFHQKIKIKPEKGLTVFWPVDWPFVHRGVASPSQEKYIATGWYSYVEPRITEMLKINVTTDDPNQYSKYYK